MQFPRDGPPSNELNDLHVLDSHVGPDFADGVDLGLFANYFLYQSALKHAVSPKWAPFQTNKTIYTYLTPMLVLTLPME